MKNEDMTEEKNKRTKAAYSNRYNGKSALCARPCRQHSRYKGGVYTFEKALYRYPTLIGVRADQGYGGTFRTRLHKHMRTSFRQILPQTALKILAGQKPACGFLPTLQQNYARKSAHISYEDRLLNRTQKFFIYRNIKIQQIKDILLHINAGVNLNELQTVIFKTENTALGNIQNILVIDMSTLG